MNLIPLLTENLLHALPILIAGILAFAIVIERAIALYRVYPLRELPAFAEKILDLLLAGKEKESLELCESLSSKPAARVLKSALLRLDEPEELIRNNLEISVAQATQAIQRRTSFLATIANVATLLGLFGTIAGLIHSFEAVGHADPQQKSALLAAGISQAMNATMLGLGVAIPCMIAFSFLVQRQNLLAGEIEQTAVRALDLMQRRALYRKAKHSERQEAA
jgi:biopolymer transport protein ExbB